MEARLDAARKQSATDRDALDELKKQLADTQDAYQKLLQSKESLLDASSKQSREFLAELQAKQDSIAALNEELAKKQADLRTREARVAQLEGMIAQIQDKLSSIKNDLMKALVGYEGKGLTITQRNGKIYVSLENRLLFPSGSWQIDSEGRRAIEEITKVLVSQPDIHVMIEGHTDNVPYRSSGTLKDNWDLSVMRATTIVRAHHPQRRDRPPPHHRRRTQRIRTPVAQHQFGQPGPQPSYRGHHYPGFVRVEKMLDELEID